MGLLDDAFEDLRDQVLSQLGETHPIVLGIARSGSFDPATGTEATGGTTTSDPIDAIRERDRVEMVAGVAGGLVKVRMADFVVSKADVAALGWTLAEGQLVTQPGRDSTQRRITKFESEGADRFWRLSTETLE